LNLHANRFIADPKRIYYAIDYDSYDSEIEYEEAKREFELAVWDWQQICGVTFYHKDGLDKRISGTVPASVFFVVCKADYENRNKFAEAFYSFCDHSNHFIQTFKRFHQSTPYERIGIYKHEIGHLLGFTHEQTISAKDCRLEGTTALDNTPNQESYWQITPYESLSIMHFNCDLVGPDNLAFSKMDSVGALSIFPW